MIATLAQEEASLSGERLESKSLTASSQMAIKAEKNLMFPLKKWQRLDSESRELQAALGVSEITFLNYRDGSLIPTIELRRDIVKAIRIAKPDRMVVQSPERNWERIYSSHPDHLAAGESAIQAIYPDARNPYAFPELKAEGIEPWRVREVFITGSPTPNHFIDITETIDKKIAALKAHISQTAHNPELESMVRQWGERNAEANGLAAGRVAEIFKVVSTD